MQQPVENGRRKDFVASQQFGPVSNGLVGGDDHGAAAIAVADEPEEQARLLAVHRVVSHLVDQQQRR